MSDESLSALLDGECSPEELDRLLTQLDRSPELRARLSRMQCARDLGRGVAVQARTLDFADRVSAALADEAPQVSDKVVAFRPRRSAAAPAPSIRTRLRPAVGFAAAAGLGALAVIAGPRLTGTDTVPAVAGPSLQFAANDARVARDDVQNVALRDTPASPQQRLRRAAELRWAQLEEPQAQQLNAYLIDYSNYRSAQGFGGTLGYARYAAHTADYRPRDEQR